MTTESVKTWFKKNWAYVVGVVVAVGGIAAAVAFSGKNGADVIDPFVIDRAKDDWMDQLDSGYTGPSGSKMTVRQAMAAGHYDNYIFARVVEQEILKPEVEAKIFHQYAEKYPEQVKILDSIEGYFAPPEEWPKEAT